MDKTFIAALFIGVKKVLNKIQHPFLMLKITLNKIGVGEQFFNVN